jgi:hypothetical protein
MNRINDINNLLSKFEQISNQYLIAQKEKKKIGFNIFKTISDTWYRENFHSDIISSILNITENNTKANTQLFISMLNEIYVYKKLDIQITGFKQPIIEKEIDRIDISIKDEIIKQAIIIENKINNAGDQFRQIPKYIKKLVEKGYSISSIIYIPLTKGKIPKTVNWTETEKDIINKKLLIIPAYEKNVPNLCENWLEKIMLNSNSIDVISTIRQYSKLLKHLTAEYMDRVLMQDFIETMRKDNNFQIAKIIQSSLENLREFQAWEIKNNFEEKGKPIFNQIQSFVYKNVGRAKFENFIKNNENLYLIFSVSCLGEKYVVKLDNTKKEKSGNNEIEKIIDKCNLVSDFEKHSEFNYSKTFEFPKEETTMNELITKLLDNIQKTI